MSWLLGIVATTAVLAGGFPPAAGAGAIERVGWLELPGLDNYGYDIRTSSSRDVEELKRECLQYDLCAGFSSAFGTLKWNVSNSTLGAQPNTILFVRQPPPPSIQPPLPAFSGWPAPNNLSLGDPALRVQVNGAEFSFRNLSPRSSQVLDDALVRYKHLMFPGMKNSALTFGVATTNTTLLGCEVRVATADKPLAAGVDESYTLHIPSSAGSGDLWAQLTAATVWGALRGLEQLAQMVHFDTPGAAASGAGYIDSVPIHIEDGPRFAYRGLMIDTARHFWPLPTILEHLEAMAAAKMNVLHWHIVDSQSFPFVSAAHPLLSARGAYAAAATYSHDDVREVVAYARDRGIRVIPEFDMPAHSTSWFKGYPNLEGSAKGVMDPTSEATYDFIDALFAEIVGLFPDDVLHVGCDELPLAAWNTSAIREWMRLHGIPDLAHLETYWLKRIASIAGRYNRTIRTWHDPINNGADLPAGASVEVWGGDIAFLNQIASKGDSTVYAAPFYLDNLGKQWNDFYSEVSGCLPETPIDPHVVGIEACMWSEWVDETNSISRVWPRAAAVAEIMWSHPDLTRPFISQLAAARLGQWRCRMRLRGIGVEPVGALGTGPFYCGPDAQ